MAGCLLFLIVLLQIVEQTPDITAEKLFYLLVGFASSVIGAMVTAIVYLSIKRDKDKDRYIESQNKFHEQLSQLTTAITAQGEAAKKQADAADKQVEALDRLRETVFNSK